MWRLMSISARNICAFKELNYTLNQGITTLVFGNNLDNDSQKSNGAGKSALTECIALGIIGSPLRKIKSDEIIRDDAEECSIRLEFENVALHASLTIERHFYRKGSSTVSCQFVHGEERQIVAQPGVDEYNKYILGKLGISREELYNNFILSKYKYQDFLSSSDNDKKEIINRFSNAVLVDEAIAIVLNKRKPIEERFRNTELNLAEADGRMKLLEEQIEQEEKYATDRVSLKSEKLGSLKRQIQEKKALIRTAKDGIEGLKAKIPAVESADRILQELENSDEAIESYCTRIKELLSTLDKDFSSWEHVISEKKNSLQIFSKEYAERDQALTDALCQLEQVNATQDSIQEDYNRFSQAYTVSLSKYEGQLNELISRTNLLQKGLNILKNDRRKISGCIEIISNKLSGTILCPECGYEFLNSDTDFDIESAKQSLQEYREELEHINAKICSGEKEMETNEGTEERIWKEKRILANEKDGFEVKLALNQKEINKALFVVEEIKRNQERTNRQISSLEDELSGVKRKIFDEAFECVDEVFRGIEKQEKSLSDDIETYERSINMLDQAYHELENATQESSVAKLKASLKESRWRHSEILKERRRIDSELEKSLKQEDCFQKFKSYLANSKIEALSQVTNQFLQSVGSDIQVKFSGYTLLKSGKVREKISVNLLRNGIDCGSFGKFSEGERARVNLASILAMQKLVNGNADFGKGLDLLILDEILAAVDESGLTSMFSALNELGVTCIIISHGNIAENYPYRLIVNKQNGESFIDAN